jgi:hypothetical protein
MPHMPPRQLAPRCVRRVFDHDQSVAARDVENCADVAGEAAVVESEDCRRRGSDRSLDVGGIEVQVGWPDDVTEDGPSA